MAISRHKRPRPTHKTAESIIHQSHLCNYDPTSHDRVPVRCPTTYHPHPNSPANQPATQLPIPSSHPLRSQLASLALQCNNYTERKKERKEQKKKNKANPSLPAYYFQYPNHRNIIHLYHTKKEKRERKKALPLTIRPNLTPHSINTLINQSTNPISMDERNALHRHVKI